MYICNERPIYISQIAVFTYSTGGNGVCAFCFVEYVGLFRNVYGILV